jgi:hypothetical protein
MSDEPSHYIALSDAAALLGLSTEATRKRIQRGTLAGLKIDGAWFVEQSSLPDSPDVRPTMHSRHPDAGNHTAGRHLDDDGPDVRTMEDTPAVDLTPLVEMVSRLHAENRQLTEAATIWQMRARQAEEKLAALEAGPIAAPAPEHDIVDAPESAPEAPQRVEDAPEGDSTLHDLSGNPVPTEVQLATGWRRWFRRIMGYEG